MNPLPEIFIMVDVETSGPIPGDYSMLSIGAVIVGQHRGPFANTFYLELKPLPGAKVDPKAMEVNKLDIEHLRLRGADPESALTLLRNWVIAAVKKLEMVRPVMVSNGTFDPMWVLWYFTHFDVRSPFSVNTLDMKSFYMGRQSRIAWVNWSQTTTRSMQSRHPEWYDETLLRDHHALNDAIQQAEVFERMLKS